MTSLTPNFTQNDPKFTENTIKLDKNDSFDLEFGMDMFFWDEKTDGDVRISKFVNLDPFCDVTVP